MTYPALKIVQSTDDALRDSFAREDALIAELAAVKAQQRALRIDYARERGLMILPSLEIIRKALDRD